MIKTKCPYCGYVATEHSMLENRAIPKNDDISFCINCGEVSQFQDGKLIKADLSQFDNTTKDELKRIESAWVRTKKLSELRKKTR